MQTTKILVIGASGRIGTGLTAALALQYGQDKVIAADVHRRQPGSPNYIQLDALDHAAIERAVERSGVTQIYLLAAAPSVTGEQHLDASWKLNVHSLLSVLEIARTRQLDKVFWPSSIAVFEKHSPRYNCHQQARTQPESVYGISKRAGEYWCNYYFEKYGVDIRSLRYPDLITYAAPPGGGAADYAVEAIHQALEKKQYACFLAEDNCLPMIYMPEVVRATLELMNAPKERLTIRTSYNISALSFAPCDLTAAIRKHLPDFNMRYLPDHRDVAARSGPVSINDTEARRDWGWKPAYRLKDVVDDMLQRLARQKGICPEPGGEKNEMEFYPHEHY